MRPKAKARELYSMRELDLSATRIKIVVNFHKQLNFSMANQEV
jgi:hypothetical protein